jgi:hypothetical protein
LIDLAKLALACLTREYPNKLDHVMASAADVQSPRALHPAFYGCFDWHSAVHGHWMLARLMKRHALPAAEAIFDAHFTGANIAVEAAYVRAHPLFERMYGWAWLLQLATELRGTRWDGALAPLVDAVVDHMHAFLPKQTYPVRTGVHANTAFALALAVDHARAARNAALEALVVERAQTYYARDVDYPAHLEPSGEDFLSPALIEADLMRRIAPPSWLAAFFPRGLPPNLATPAVVADRSDGKLAHLDGLNLSRAWCLRALGFHDAADAHVAAAQVATGDYAGEHWLATFAVYLHTREDGS